MAPTRRPPATHPRSAAHRFGWWLMCFTGLDVLDHHERVLFSLGYIAVLALVLLGAGKQVHALCELYRRALERRRQLGGGGGAPG